MARSHIAHINYAVIRHETHASIKREGLRGGTPVATQTCRNIQALLLQIPSSDGVGLCGAIHRTDLEKTAEGLSRSETHQELVSNSCPAPVPTLTVGTGTAKRISSHRTCPQHNTKPDVPNPPRRDKGRGRTDTHTHTL